MEPSPCTTPPCPELSKDMKNTIWSISQFRGSHNYKTKQTTFLHRWIYFRRWSSATQLIGWLLTKYRGSRHIEKGHGKKYGKFIKKILEGWLATISPYKLQAYVIIYFRTELASPPALVSQPLFQFWDSMCVYHIQSCWVPFLLIITHKYEQLNSTRWETI
jgi:hypothetical protein